MNVLHEIDREGEVTDLGLRAQLALQNGDTARSAQLRKQAGAKFEAAVSRFAKASDKDFARFLAATQYYHGGAYQEAARICDQTRQRRIPAEVRHMYPRFLKDVQERSAPDYFARYKRMLEDNYRQAITRNDPAAAQKVIDILKDHQYILPHPVMAYVRARCCEIREKRRVATQFFREAWEFEPDNPLYAIAYLDSLCTEGKHSEAWAVVEDRLEKRPGAVSSIAAVTVIGACIDRDRDANPTADGAAQRRRDDLLKHFDSALKALRTMSPGERRALAPLIDQAFLIAWAPYGEANGVEKLPALIDRWIELNPDSPHARALREIVAAPGEGSGQGGRGSVRQAEEYVNEYALRRFDEMSPILDASLV